MQTFLPYPDIEKSARCLDIKRCRKQVVEARQLINSIEKNTGWKNHPATKMWTNYLPALKHYFNIFLKIAKERKTNYKAVSMVEIPVDRFILPFWFGKESFHSAHRSNLLRKNLEYYSVFGWKETTDQPYEWPNVFCEQNF